MKVSLLILIELLTVKSAALVKRDIDFELFELPRSKLWDTIKVSKQSQGYVNLNSPLSLAPSVFWLPRHGGEFTNFHTNLGTIPTNHYTYGTTIDVIDSGYWWEKAVNVGSKISCNYGEICTITAAWNRKWTTSLTKTRDDISKSYLSSKVSTDYDLVRFPNNPHKFNYTFVGPGSRILWKKSLFWKYDYSHTLSSSSFMLGSPNIYTAYELICVSKGVPDQIFGFSIHS